ncbi:hypothetical protein GSI_08014 [Ganoderma sinense ZZ0214-1]|uniref:GH18 domain-containing protein n=1 Tax=Ganoderma sinense ZZ0214-1 TaxID=1077348 RepID=A0A2G8S8F1_9APHY|nr:hypothetical protein GSI_08014 [Ganoderma sinense ZZ0214-1]
MVLSASIKLVLFIATIALAAIADVGATAIQPRTTHYKVRANRLKAASKRASSKVNAAYYPNWAIYSPYDFQPTEINTTSLTHLFYAFADISTDSERNLKTVLSVGGGSCSDHFSFITDSSKRATFVTSAVQMIEDYGFDGTDVDFEFPDTAARGSGLASLITELRTAFDDLQEKKGDTTPYILTAATSAIVSLYTHMNFPELDAALDFWNLMAYDYTGSWTDTADDQANLYGGSRTGVSTDTAINDYISRGVTVSKISLGLPVYSRSFEDTSGLRDSYDGVGSGTSEAGIYFYRDLAKSGATVYENTTDVSAYSYDSSKRELVSYDTPNIAKLKAQYVQSKGLAGTFFFDLSTDKKGNGSLVDTTADVYGDLDQTQNHINYPNSKWTNIRNNMGQGSGSSSASTTQSSTASTHQSTSTTSRSSTSTSSGSEPNIGSQVAQRSNSATGPPSIHQKV